MAVTKFSCPECQAVLKSASPIPAGKKLKCPKCGAFFPYSDPAEVAEYDDFAERDDEPEEEEREEASPRKALKKKKKGKSNWVPMLAAGIGAVILLVAAGGYAAYYFLRTPTFSEPLAFVPANSTLIMAADLESVLDQLGAQALFERLIEQRRLRPAECKAKTGLEFRELFSHFTFATTQSAQALAPGPSGTKGMWVIRSRVPFDRGKVLDFMDAKKADKKSLHGKTYYTGTAEQGGNRQTFFVPSNRLIVYMVNFTEGEEAAVLAADGAKIAPPADTMALIDQAKQGQGWVAVPLDPAIKGNLLAAGAGAGGQEGAALAASLQQAKGLTFWVTLDNSVLKANAGFLCNDSASASQLAQVLQKAWEKQTQGVAGGMQMALAVGFLPKPAQDVVRQLIQGVRFSAQGSVALASTQTTLQAVQTALAEAQRSMASGALVPPGSAP
jgi:hypothetical protein